MSVPDSQSESTEGVATINKQAGATPSLPGSTIKYLTPRIARPAEELISTTRGIAMSTEEVPTQALVTAMPRQEWISSEDDARGTVEVPGKTSGVARLAKGRITTIMDVVRNKEDVPSKDLVGARHIEGLITPSDDASSTVEETSHAEGLSTITADASQDQLVARPIEGRITTSDVASSSLEDNSQAEGQSIAIAAVASSRERQIPSAAMMTTNQRKEYEKKPSQAEKLRDRIEKQRKEKRLNRMLSCRNLDQAKQSQNPNPSLGTCQVVSKLISRFETDPSPIKVPRPAIPSIAVCRKPSEVPFLKKKLIPGQYWEQNLKPVQTKSQDMMSSEV